MANRVFLHPKSTNWKIVFLNPKAVLMADDSLIKTKAAQTEAEMLRGYVPEMAHREKGSASFIDGLASGLYFPSEYKYRDAQITGANIHTSKKCVTWEMKSRNSQRPA